MEKGKYILIEGGDGAGKTTQARLLYQSFVQAGLASKLAREPGGTPISEKIRCVIGCRK